ncbi:hypothetical protein L1987_13514 [Smallanthus sonchifolius]|uniref:Uncharacterized protein n=1 Tax=Smallanthus sonchifolius TaxID=185202 RepID=A0ACB9JGP2_9ASTR|nr:hypothetical protein L1987_13514 [Smallanthus sonchifolius]
MIVHYHTLNKLIIREKDDALAILNQIKQSEVTLKVSLNKANQETQTFKEFFYRKEFFITDLTEKLTSSRNESVKLQIIIDKWNVNKKTQNTMLDCQNSPGFVKKGVGYLDSNDFERKLFRPPTHGHYDPIPSPHPKIDLAKLFVSATNISTAGLKGQDKDVRDDCGAGLGHKECNRESVLSSFFNSNSQNPESCNSGSVDSSNNSCSRIINSTSICNEHNSFFTPASTSQSDSQSESDYLSTRDSEESAYDSDRSVETSTESYNAPDEKEKQMTNVDKESDQESSTTHVDQKKEKFIKSKKKFKVLVQQQSSSSSYQLPHKRKYFKHVNCFTYRKGSHTARQCSSASYHNNLVKFERPKMHIVGNFKRHQQDHNPFYHKIDIIRVSRRTIDNAWHVDSECSRHMTGLKDLLTDFRIIDGGYVAFAGDKKGGKTTGQGTLSVLFNNTECLFLKPGIVVPEDVILLRTPRRNNTYIVDMNDPETKASMACLLSKASDSESLLWHHRLGHVNFKNINRLVKKDLVRGFPSKEFNFSEKCMACAKGKHHKKSHKSKAVNSISVPLQLLHMDLFGPVGVKSISKNSYFLVVTDDFSTYSWVNFLATKDDTAEVLKSLILKIEKICKRLVISIRSDNGIEFKNHESYYVDWHEANTTNTRTGPDWFYDADIILNNFIPPAPPAPEPSPSAKPSFIPSIQAEDEFMPFSTRITPIVDDPMSFSVNSTVTSYHSEAADTAPVNTSGDVISGTTATVNSNIDQDLTNDPSVGSDSDSENDNNGPVIPDEYLTNLRAQVEVAYGPSFKTLSNHPLENVIGPITEGVRTRSYSTLYNTTLCACFLSQYVPNNISMALKDSSWINAMQEELAQFRKLKVWDLVDLPKNKYPIGTRWVFRNKTDERNVVIKNKARLVYQMDVKSAFLYGKVKEEVYVCQPPGFEDPDYPSQVYKLDKPLYGLHQAPRAWYDTLLTYLLQNDFERGKTDMTLFKKKIGKDIIIVHIYVDDIIFGPTNEKLCRDFEDVMKANFEMSKMDMLKKFQTTDSKAASIPFVAQNSLSADPECKKQTSVSISSAEAEYIVASSCCSQSLWIQHQIMDYGINLKQTPMFIDNEACVKILKNPIYHSKTKHIDVRVHAIWDAYEKEYTQVLPVNTNDKKADIFTKAFDKSKFLDLV